MSDRLNTLACIFDPRSPRISAYNIHEWIHDNLRLAEADIRMLQVDGPKRTVYIKFTDEERLKEVLQVTDGTCEYKHDSGEISQVRVELAGMGTKKVRIAGLPPEVKENTVKEHLTQYGEIMRIRDEMWAAAYRYKVYNGVRIADIKLKKHIPSHMSIAANDVMISYDGQPPTCYRCNNTGHQQSDCPRKKRLEQRVVRREPTWADIVSQATREPQQDTRLQQVNTTQGLRTVIPILKGDSPPETVQCPHPQGKQDAALAMDDVTPLIDHQSMNTDKSPLDTQRSSDGSTAPNVRTTIEEQTWATITLMETTGTPENQTMEESEARVTPVSDTECTPTMTERRHSFGSNSDEESIKDDATMAAPPSKIGRTKKIKIDRDETVLRTRNRSKSRNKSYNV